MIRSPITKKVIVRSGFRMLLPALILLGSFTAWAQDAPSVKAAPDYEKRSSIQAVDGFVYLSEDRTLADTRAAAYSVAKRQALEMAKTYVQSKTKVTNYVMEYDMIWSESEGMVTILEQKDYGIENNTRYHVWIKAEVEYSLKPKKPIPSESMDMDPSAPLTVKVWTDKKMYKEGEAIQVQIRGNKDFYAKIIDITASGDIIQLLPNDYRKINFFKKETIYTVPDTVDRFSLIVSPPFGQDKIVVYASELPMGDIKLAPLGNGLNKYTGTQQTFADETRDLSLAPENNATPFQGAEFYEAAWIIATEQKH